MMNACEQEWIARANEKGWKLCNHTDGGDAGFEFSAATREKLARISKEKWNDPEYIKKWNAGNARRRITKRMPSPEQVAKRDEARRRREATVAKRKREQAHIAMMKTVTVLTHCGAAFIPLSKGAYAVVNREDLNRVAGRRWYCGSHEGGARPVRTVTAQGKCRKQLMSSVLGYRPAIIGQGCP